jgi:hypothetical protein
MIKERLRTCVVLLIGLLLGAAGYAILSTADRAALAQTAKPASDLQTLTAEIERIKGILPDQSHAMQDVSYHFSNLWFAGQQKHWDLAHFYWSETRSHLRWAVRIIPKRKDAAGREVDLQAILQAVENTPLKQLEDSIKAKDNPTFERAYRFTLEGCYSCHKASDKPFLRPRIPTTSESAMINFDPIGDWPK